MSLYFDHNATTPLEPRVLEAMLPYLNEQFGNPNGVYCLGRLARNAVDTARGQVAGLVGADPSQVVFTSGGTEANNMAIRGMAVLASPRPLLVSAIEHSAVLEPAERVEQRGVLPVTAAGRLDLSALPALPVPGAVSVMLANNETGVIQPVAEVADWARGQGALVHTDAVQGAGKMAVDFRALGVHFLTLSSHKIYGPKGIGALVVDKAIDLPPLIRGGGQERGRRGGTEPVPLIVGFGVACELAAREWSARAAHCLALRERLESALHSFPGVEIFGAQARDRLPNTTFFGVPGYDGETLLMLLDRDGVAVSSGAACAAGSTEPSHVLVAMAAEHGLARSAVRVSLGKDNTAADVDALIASLRRRLPSEPAG